MNAPVSSKTFKSGNSVAVRLPASFGIAENTPIEIAREGRRVIITQKLDPAEEKRKLREYVDAMNALPPLSEPWPKREPIDFPDRWR